MALDTKVLDRRTARRTERRTDGQRQNNIPPPMARDNNTTTAITDTKTLMRYKYHK
ncbi:hypothetical protein DPMN_034940 [Dreissena polymorpha]|uniref:Uncharacterized protein n=1 Tax=Dreissena polymorpha TaxID=45954 RepID=A0A9D4M8C5_DREPO|nr:hypothetical protein DPMN_034940 [Dreissena polymorpha]